MKKLFRTMIAVAVAAAAMTSCSKEMQEVTEVTGTPINVTMQGPETKAVFGTPSGTTYPVVWQENDEVKVMALKTPGDKAAVRVVEGKKYTVTVAEEGKKASFTTETPSAATTPYQFFVLSPYSAFVSCGDDATNNDYIHQLNRKYRQIDRPTDVLSFALNESEEPDIENGPDIDVLGDIILSVERAEEQAADYGHSLRREIAFLTVHGMLHLLGYDHMEEADRLEMEKEQRYVMEQLGIACTAENLDLGLQKTIPARKIDLLDKNRLCIKLGTEN